MSYYLFFHTPQGTDSILLPSRKEAQKLVTKKIKMRKYSTAYLLVKSFLIESYGYFRSDLTYNNIPILKVKQPLIDAHISSLSAEEREYIGFSQWEIYTGNELEVQQGERETLGIYRIDIFMRELRLENNIIDYYHLNHGGEE